ncbi:MAG: tocopherol cyclase family protein [Clostridia bacterium]
MILSKIYKHILFQGNLQKKHYFEGWYYKQVAEDEQQVISFIPGISLFADDPHSFVQYIFVSFDENQHKTIQTGYLKYPLAAFKTSNNPFSIQVGENIFSETMLKVDLHDEKMQIKGKLAFGSFTPIEKSLLMPNIMGIFAYIPKMECYHGVISMNHTVSGNLAINGQLIDFSFGKGYLEKDWGTSFPSEYIWLQCNNFQDTTTSLFASVAKIPFMHNSFKGFICNIRVAGEEYRFATYKNSQLLLEEISPGKIKLVLENRQASLTITASYGEQGELLAPHKGEMHKIIKEGLSGKVEIKFYHKKSKQIYEDTGNMAGIEIVGY